MGWRFTGLGRALIISVMHFHPVQRGTGARIAAATSAIPETAQSVLYAIQWQAANSLAGLAMLAVGALSAQRGVVAAERGGVGKRIIYRFCRQRRRDDAEDSELGAKRRAAHQIMRTGTWDWAGSGSVELQPQLPHGLA